MTMRQTCWNRARRAARSFAEARSGVAALEFALVAAPFLFMLFAIIEIAMVMFASAALETATEDAAREIRTGRFGGGDAAAFKEDVCNRAVMINCDRLYIDVRTWANFSAINPSNPVGENGELDDSDFGFDTAAAREHEIVLVRVFYDWQVLTPMLGMGFSNMSGNRRLITAAVAFRNEPFGS